MTDPRALALRWVDGVPHVALGPLALAFVGDAARLTGVGRARLIPFLVGFTLYGVVVLWGLRGGHAPGWLLRLALGTNLLVLLLVGISLAWGQPTRMGWWLHVMGLVGGIGMVAVLSFTRRGGRAGP